MCRRRLRRLLRSARGLAREKVKGCGRGRKDQNKEDESCDSDRTTLLGRACPADAFLLQLQLKESCQSLWIRARLLRLSVEIFHRRRLF